MAPGSLSSRLAKTLRFGWLGEECSHFLTLHLLLCKEQSLLVPWSELWWNHAWVGHWDFRRRDEHGLHPYEEILARGELRREVGGRYNHISLYVCIKFSII